MFLNIGWDKNIKNGDEKRNKRREKKRKHTHRDKEREELSKKKSTIKR